MNTLCLLLSLSGYLLSQSTPVDSLHRLEWGVDGGNRSALVYAPLSAKSKVTPVIFAFHGHGGTMLKAARSFRYHELWPEAIVVYMQGLPTPGRLTDPEGKKTGWQHSVGGQNDRDLKFFDVVLKSLKADYKIDPNRIYATGHSNGGGFTYVLLAARADVFAAVAPFCSADFEDLKAFKPRPILIVAGREDPMVKFEWQERMMQALRKINGCEAEGKKKDDRLTVYASSKGTPVATYIYDGGHAFPSQAPQVTVQFFQHHPAADAKSKKSK